MASRTNKIGILKKRKQLQKIKILKWNWRSINKNLSDSEKLEKDLIFDMQNPKSNKFSRDKSWRKVICKQTWLREDTDGYRLLFKPNSSEVIYKFGWFNARLNRIVKKGRK